MHSCHLKNSQKYLTYGYANVHSYKNVETFMCTSISLYCTLYSTFT